MATAKIEVDKFTGENDFSLWKIKMRALLVQEGLSHASDEDAMNQLREKDQAEAMNMNAKSP